MLENEKFYHVRNLAEYLNIRSLREFKKVVTTRGFRCEAELVLKYYDKICNVKLLNPNTNEYERLLRFDKSVYFLNYEHELSVKKAVKKVFSYMYNPELIQTHTLSEIKQLILKKVEEKNYNDFCSIIHDVALNYLSKNSQYLHYLQKGCDLEDIAVSISYIVYKNLLSRISRGRDVMVVDWIRVILRILKSPFVITGHLVPSVEKFYKHKNDILLDRAIKVASGVGVYIIPEVSDSIQILPGQLIDVVMNLYCVYKKETKLYRALKMSLYFSIGRNEIILFKLPKSERNNLIYLFNQFHRFINKIEFGKLIVERSDFCDI